MKKISLRALKIIGVFTFWLAVWVLISFSVDSELLFPNPISVIKALGALIVTADFWISTALSLLRVFIGILISIIIGTLLAVLTVKVRVLDTQIGRAHV